MSPRVQSIYLKMLTMTPKIKKIYEEALLNHKTLLQEDINRELTYKISAVEKDRFETLCMLYPPEG